MESEDTTIIDSENPEMEEFINWLIDVFQEFLSVRKVDLHNNEQTEDGWPDPSLIHGSDYEELHDSIDRAVKMWGFVF